MPHEVKDAMESAVGTAAVGCDASPRRKVTQDALPSAVLQTAASVVALRRRAHEEVMLRATNHATVGRPTPMSTRGMGEWKTILGAAPSTALPDLVTTLKAPKVTRVSCRWRRRRRLTVLRFRNVEGHTLMQQLDEQMPLQGAASWTTLPDSVTKWKASPNWRAPQTPRADCG